MPRGRSRGRKLGVLTDGVDATRLGGLRQAAEAAGAQTELTAPKVGGVTAGITEIDGGCWRWRTTPM